MIRLVVKKGLEEDLMGRDIPVHQLKHFFRSNLNSWKNIRYLVHH
jgi:hypothetical protein